MNKPEVLIKNWALINPNRLNGKVYNHTNFADGDVVNTSSVINIIDCDTYKILETHNTNYKVFAEDVNEDYEKCYPNAYNRLNLTQI